MNWLRLFRPGDWLLALLAVVVCIAIVPFAWQHGNGERAIVRRGGEVVAELDLSRNQRINVAGPIGITVVAVDQGRVRVAADPGSHQYCVRQGWLKRAGEVAICAPNQVSVQVEGRNKAYDSLSY
ncbi:NusG domain II-containing protein [uncultured Propionivibrio sp.]|uniref:NusG domain II-containing protein n=1 Tax=uncultured Propionivibrio sp. TaxID=426737 RepID=UPI0029BFEA27|nr:NusG domain II-containing protein [uncultured Propionivibrio sp.]